MSIFHPTYFQPSLIWTTSMSSSTLASYTCNKTLYHRGHALTIQNLSLSHDGGHLLFGSADVCLQYECITGLVAVNGAGKTSLVKLIASKTLPGFPADILIEYLAASDDEEFLAGTIDDDLLSLQPLQYIEYRIQTRTNQLQTEIDALEARLEVAVQEETETLANELGELYDILDGISEQVQRELDQALSDTGLSAYTHLSLEDLSCGWRYKTRLIAAFLTHPDLLIVDEPSFLDATSTDWFIGKMIDAKKTSMVVLISHKENLLERLCDHILYINAGNQTLSSYHCGYRVFRDVHSVQVQNAQKTIANTEKKHDTAEKSLKNIQSQLRRRETSFKETTTQHADKRFIKGKNKEAKQKADKSAASKLKQTQQDIVDLEIVRRQARTERVKEIHLEGLAIDGTIISLVDVAFGYDDNLLFQYVDACMVSTDRVLLSAANGSGKSTLVKLIMGELEPRVGTISRKGQCIYFPQTALSQLLRVHGQETALAFLGGSLTETQARSHLGVFGLAGDLAVRCIRTLSAGQRVRLWLAKQQLDVPKASLLIVDEITENVDVETRRSLAALIASYKGAVLVVSHDQDFVQKLQLTKTWYLHLNGIHEQYADA